MAVYPTEWSDMAIDPERVNQAWQDYQVWEHNQGLEYNDQAVFVDIAANYDLPERVAELQSKAATLRLDPRQQAIFEEILAAFKELIGLAENHGKVAGVSEILAKLKPLLWAEFSAILASDPDRPTETG